MTRQTIVQSRVSLSKVRQNIVNMPYSLIFNGSTQYGYASTVLPYILQNFTVEFWAKPQPASGLRIIFSLGDNYFVGFTTSNQTQVSYCQFNGNQVLPSGSTYTPNVWQHFVFTCSVMGSGSFATITWDTYINGVLVKSYVNNSGMYGNYGSTMYIGSFGGTTNPFAGELGQITYYSTPLTQAQVLQRYQNASAQSVAPGSVVSQWLLTEGTGSALYDSVGSTYITLIGSPTWAGDSPFKVRQNIVNMPYSLIFNGSSQYGTSTNVTPYQIPTKTIELWAKAATTNPGLQVLFGTASPNYWVGIGTINAMEISYSNPSINVSGESYYGVIIPGTWQHLAYVFSVSGSTVVIYLYCNGILVYTATAATGYSSSYGPELYLGQFVVDTNYYFNGKIAQLTFYNTALTAAQVLQRYNNVPAQNVAPGSVVSQWLFSEGTGSVLYDSVGSTHITLIGSPTWSGDSPFKTRTKAT